MDWPYLLACFLLPLLASLGLTFLLLVALRRIGLYDRPNERSLHDTPTPRGGGLAPAAVLVAGIAAVAGPEGLPPVAWLPLLGGALLLAATGWRDDRAGLSPLAKLLPQLVAVSLGMVALSSGGLTFQGWLPDVLDRPVAALLWLWFVNLYNFMDGSDGLAAGEATAIGLGLALGYLVGWLLLDAAGRGHWAAALILPGYFLADASLTLARRAVRGENLLAAHAGHFSQQAVRNGLGHRGTLVTVMAGNLVLIAFALGAERGEVRAALIGAALTVAYLLYRLARGPRVVQP